MKHLGCKVPRYLRLSLARKRHSLFRSYMICRIERVFGVVELVLCIGTLSLYVVSHTVVPLESRYVVIPGYLAFPRVIV